DDMNALTRHLLCIDKNSGKIIWQKAINAEMPEDPWRSYIREHGYASQTPVSDGERVYCFFGKTGVYAFDMDGKQLWKRGVGKESADRRWGSAASPILYKDILIINAGDESRKLYGLNKNNGEVVWEYESPKFEMAYATPVLVEREDGKTLFVLGVPGAVGGFDPETGEVVWRASIDIPGNLSPSPVLLDDKVIILGGWPERQTIAIKLGGENDVTNSHILWQTRTTSYVSTPIAHEGYIYWIDEKGNAHCVNVENGDTRWSHNLGLRGRGMRCYASSVLIGEHVVAVTRFDGTYVFKATPEGYKQVAHNVIESDDSMFNATPAISEGKLYLRSNEYLYAIGDKKRAGR
ncbi:MAG: PQQ-like beta-propeller repeat protein, partial [Rhodospirillales bacterium]|nr:PQQ-like beta-propeller repeat protein [Rhodospirillales bacterium]